MTIQPNNQAPKFQDPAQTPDRTEETRTPDAPKSSRSSQASKDNIAKDNMAKDHAVKDNAVNDNAARDNAARDNAVKDPTTKDNAVRDNARDNAVKDDAVRADAAKSEGTRTDGVKADAVKPDAVKSDAAKDKAAAKDGRHGASDSEVTKSPEHKDAKRAPENQAPVAARTRLFEDQDVTRFREQWRELQAGFVDEPRGAVREADTLVSQMMDALTAQLTEQKRALQGESDARDTEQLRVALQRYRSLFDQMLQV